MAIRRESTGEENAFQFAIKIKARTVVGREEKSLLSDPGSELLLEGIARECENNKWDGKKKKKKFGVLAFACFWFSPACSSLRLAPHGEITLHLECVSLSGSL